MTNVRRTDDKNQIFIVCLYLTTFFRARLVIPGRHVNKDDYVADKDGYIVLAGSAPKGTIYETPFGYKGKIYDRGTYGNHLDVYIR